VRRKLLHLIEGQQVSPLSLERLNQFIHRVTYLPVDRRAFELAAEMRASLRSRGLPSTPPEAIDVDVILAAQARQLGGIVVTENVRHFLGLVPVLSPDRMDQLVPDFIPYGGGYLPPCGYILCEFEGRMRAWARPGVLTSKRPRTPLSPEVEQRVMRIHQSIADVCGMTLSDMQANFERDLRPENETAVWEHLVHVFENECQRRDAADIESRRLLYLAVVQSSLTSSLDELLCVMPEAKSIPALERLVSAVQMPPADYDDNLNAS
jgi:hypothetical protein